MEPDNTPDLTRLLDTSLAERTYILIKKEILANRLLPRRPLPVREIAKALGVSATPVREALAQLISDGLVERVPNKIACVAKVTEEQVKHVYEARRLVEPYATIILAGAAAQRNALRKELEQLSARIGRIEETHKSNGNDTSVIDEYVAVDLDFHGALEAGVQNALVRKLVQLVNDHSLRIRSFSEAVSESSKAIIKEVCEEHLAIINAVLDSDLKRAKKAVLKHLEIGESRTMDALRELRE